MNLVKRVRVLMVLLFLLIFLTCFAGPAAYATPPIMVEPDLQAKMASDGSAGYLIYFREKPDLTGASAMAWQNRGAFVADALQTTARGTQDQVRQYLDSRQVAYKSFWVANVIVVEESDRAVLDDLQRFPEIESIKARRTLPLPEPISQEPLENTPQLIEPNIIHVKADQVWALGYNGASMVVATIDTGVRFTHHALVGQYRGNLGTSFDHNYNWWDPTASRSTTPFDDVNHGTHVMGIMAGDDGAGNRIGVAPGAKWIACRGCISEGCPDDTLISCGQFILAPTDLMGNNPDPAKRPHVVNNSWGVATEGGDKWYWAIVGAWQAAGIYPVFSNGNDGPKCGSVGTPGDFPNVTAVGNIDHTTNQPADRSSRGPGIFQNTINPMGYPYLKPQVSAPGMNIRSSIPTGDDDYKNMNGTSMAAPHVAGLVALMLQAGPCLTYAQVERIIMQTATPISYVSGCGVEGPGGVPNNATGWGVINALEAVNQVLGVCGAMGALEGWVTSQSRPVVGATVTTEARLTALTDEDGHYAFPHLSAGIHTVTVTAFDFYQESATVAIAGNSTATENFTLQAKPKVSVRGQVTDGSGAGWPLYATLTASTLGFDDTVGTDPVTGQYSLTLSMDTNYTFTVSSKGYTSENRAVTTSGPFTPQDFVLKVDRACSAPGYREIQVLYEAFEGDFPPPGWTTVSLGGTNSVWRRNDYFKERNHTNGSGFCAQAGADDPCDKWDAGLISPPIDIPSGEVATLFYENRFFPGGHPFEIWLDATADGGATWHTLTDWTRERGPLLEQVDLSGFAGSPFQVRWHYSTKGGWCSYYQQIDNVKITSGCQPLQGGLVVGHVYDDNTGKPIAGITVSDDTSGSAMSDASGAYVLFSDSGTHALTATPAPSSGYGSATQHVTVRTDRVMKQDFDLPAGRLSFQAEALDVILRPDSTRQRTLRLINRGRGGASFQFSEATEGTAMTAFESARVGGLAFAASAEVPWLSESPSNGTVPARGGKVIKVIFDSKGLSEGTYAATLTVDNDTPYGPLSIPVTMRVVDRGGPAAETPPDGVR